MPREGIASVHVPREEPGNPDLWERVGTVQSLHIYPVKSMRGCDVQEATVSS